jgi:hypothetical protein
MVEVISARNEKRFETQRRKTSWEREGVVVLTAMFYSVTVLQFYKS